MDYASPLLALVIFLIVAGFGLSFAVAWGFGGGLATAFSPVPPLTIHDQIISGLLRGLGIVIVVVSFAISLEIVAPTPAFNWLDSGWVPFVGLLMLFGGRELQEAAGEDSEVADLRRRRLAALGFVVAAAALLYLIIVY